MRAGLLEALASIVGEPGLTTAQSELERHGHGESYHPAAPPEVVVYPQTTDAVAAVVRACRERATPIVPFGAGTSLEGHVAALRSGVCVDLSLMNRVLAIRAVDLDATVEAGVTRLQLERALRPEGLFFPVDPGADATIGGMIATAASGTTAVRYGTMRENVLSLLVVLPDGTTLRTRSRARKSAAGYDLTHLFVGSEGTLGIVTEAVLRVQPVAEAIAAAVCSFPDLERAVTCVVAAVQAGIAVARADLLDEVLMEALRDQDGLAHTAAPTIFFEFHGTPEAVEADARATAEIAAELGGSQFAWSTREEDRRKLWAARHRTHDVSVSLRPGWRPLSTDVCVPLSRLVECIVETQADRDASGLFATLVGHVGDGNFHFNVLFDPDDDEQVERVLAFNERLVRRAIAMEGTCTGEHGVGYGKTDFLELEHGARAVELMRAIKRTVDPDGLLNPGKIVRLE